MCIALLSTAHPAYKLILIDNRDEYINRPTATASWWSAPHQSVLGGRDLLRSTQGTWLGVTKTGRIAVLTNFREDTPPPPTAVSRGEIIKKFLTIPEEEFESTADFVRDVVDDGVARDAGGFSLVCGRVGEQLAVISNRARSGEEVPWIMGDVVQTVGLSNTHFGDRAWPKVVEGEEGMLRVLRQNLVEFYPQPKNGKGHDELTVVKDDAEESLIEGLLELLSDDALTRKGMKAEDGLEAHIFQLRTTIRVPPLGRKEMKADEVAAARKDEVAKVLGSREGVGPIEDAKKAGLGVSGIYATQKQTVVLVDHNDRVRFVERTLFDDDCEPVPAGKGDVDITFQIEQPTKG